MTRLSYANVYGKPPQRTPVMQGSTNTIATIQAAYRMRMPPAVPGIRAVMRKAKRKWSLSDSVYRHYLGINRYQVAAIARAYKPMIDKLFEDHYKANIIGGIPLD